MPRRRETYKAPRKWWEGKANMKQQEMKQEMKQWITLLNDGSDNKEYLRGQGELALSLLGKTYDDVELINELTGGKNA